MMFLKKIPTTITIFLSALFLIACSAENEKSTSNNGIVISIDLGVGDTSADIPKKLDDTGRDTDEIFVDTRLPDTSIDLGFDIGPDNEPNKLRIATWNIYYLDAEGEGRAQRVEADYDRLKKYVTELHADLIALQEMHGEVGVRTLFPANIWDVECEDRDSEQNVCVVLRKSKQWNIERHPDVVSLRAGIPVLRAGLDFTISKEGFPSVRILAVHMNANCIFGDSAPGCTTFFAQIDALEMWIDERAATNEPFLVLGDFNRFMDDGDVAWNELDDGVPERANFVRSLPNDASKCWTFPTFIDHIILDNMTVAWLDASGQIGYDETDFDSYYEKLSDHCPLWADFTFPSM